MSSKKRILVIDDEVEVGNIVMEVIKADFPNTSFIADSNLARERLLENKFDLIISDVQMPGLPGPELVRLLRAHGDWTLFIFLTGQASKDLVLTALRLGASDVIEKPFDNVELIQTIQRVFEIDKRKSRLLTLQKHEELSLEEIDKQSRMLGLLHIANEKKKAG